MTLEPAEAHHRPITMMTTRTSLLVIVLLSTLIGACSAGTGAPASPSPSASASPSGSTSPSASTSPSPSSQPSESASPAPSGEITTPEQAAQRVAEVHPQFAAIGPKDPELIGGCCWYEATAVEDGFRVLLEVGWGDCPSGCIDRHQWTFAVTRQGDVRLIAESGPSVPKGLLPG